MASDRHSISKLSANFSCTQLIQDIPVLSINMPWYSCPLSPSADLAKSWKEESALNHEFLMQQGKGCGKKNIWWHLLPVIKAISCLLCDIIRTKYEAKTAFRLRSLFKKQFLLRRMQEPKPAGSSCSYSFSLPTCTCIIWQKEPSRYLNSVSLYHKHDVQWNTSTHLWKLSNTQKHLHGQQEETPV